MDKKIPDKSRPEWEKITTGEIEHNYKNFVFQTKIHQMRKDIRDGKISIDQAVDELYQLCSKYAVAVQSDLKKIFKTW